LTNGLTNTFSYSVKIHSNDDFVLINQPWILRGSIDIEGEPHQTTSFSYVNGTQFLGNANPMFLIPEVNGVNGVHFSRVLLAIGGVQQTAILTDSGTTVAERPGWSWTISTLTETTVSVARWSSRAASTTS